MPSFSTAYACLDFFAGSGLVSEGLKPAFTTVWANDICPKKAAVYRANHAKEAFHLGSIQQVRGADLPSAMLSWGSFPCQDLSLAGKMGGLSSPRSGLAWEWLRVMDEMPHRPPIIVAENVIGLISTDGGAHYRRLHEALAARGYRVGCMVLDAIHWTPQSRPRVFVVGVQQRLDTSRLEDKGPQWCHPDILERAISGLENWVWWKMPRPKFRQVTLLKVIDLAAPVDPPETTRKLISIVSDKHRRQMDEIGEQGTAVFPGYRRTRNGKQFLELRFDGIAGCLRTPDGGSSRQFLVIKRDGDVQTRLLTIREAARLMGVRDSYKIPGTYNDGYRAMGDAVAVPVVRYLAENLLAPLADLSGWRKGGDEILANPDVPFCA